MKRLFIFLFVFSVMVLNSCEGLEDGGHYEKSKLAGDFAWRRVDVRVDITRLGTGTNNAVIINYPHIDRIQFSEDGTGIVVNNILTNIHIPAEWNYSDTDNTLNISIGTDNPPIHFLCKILKLTKDILWLEYENGYFVIYEFRKERGLGY